MELYDLKLNRGPKPYGIFFPRPALFLESPKRPLKKSVLDQGAGKPFRLILKNCSMKKKGRNWTAPA